MAGKGSIVSDISMYQNNHKDDKEENDLRFTQSYGKSEVPKKKTTFKITSVTKSSQRGGSGDLLSLETDLDSMDDQDETVDSHTEDLSSEIFDTNSRATDIDSQDPLLTPEEIVKENEPKEKSARFRVVKVETKEPFKRGRWVCCDYLDAPEKIDKSDELSGQPVSFGASIPQHYVHGVDDPSKNPLLAGATGTASYKQPSAAHDVSSAYIQGDVFKPIQPAVSSHLGLILDPANQRNSFPGQVGQSSASVPYGAAQHGVQNQSVGQSLVGNRPAGTMPLLPPMQQGETQTSLSGNIPYPTPDSQFQQLPMPQGSMIPSSGRSQSGSMSMSITSPLQSQVQLQEYVAAQGQVGGSQGQSVPAYQQPMLYQSSQRSGYNLSNGVVNNAPNMGGNVANALPSQNHVPTASLYDGYMSDGPQLTVGGMSLGNLRSDGMPEAVPTLGAGLAQIAVGGVTPASPNDNEMTEEAVLQSRLHQPPVASRRPSLRTQVRNHIGVMQSSASAVAIDNKIEQAMVSFVNLNNRLKENSKSNVPIQSKVATSMDLVKSHLMYAVREEVEVLKEVIKELMERMHKVEQENMVLRSEAAPTTLSRLPPPLPPIQKPLLQEFVASLNPPGPSSSTS